MALEESLQSPMNHKKILRLMRKYNFFSKVRQANPHGKLQSNLSTSYMFYYLNRIFIQDDPVNIFTISLTTIPRWANGLFIMRKRCRH